MPRIILLTLSLCLALASQATAQKFANKIIDQIKREKGSITLSLPNWTVDIFTNETIDLPSKKDNQEFVKIKDYLGKIRFSVIGKEVEISSEYIDKIVSSDKFELYSSIKENGNRFHLWVRTKKDLIDRIFMIGESEDTTFAINLNTEVPITTFQDLDFSFNEKKK